MTNSLVLNAIIAIVLVLFAFSSITSIFVEWLNNRDGRQKRQMYLYWSIRNALNDAGMSWGTLIYRQPQIRIFKSKKNRYPVYIPASTFADALINVLKEYYVAKDLRPKPRGTPADRSLQTKTLKEADISDYQTFLDAIDAIEDGKCKRLLISFLGVPAEEKDKMKAVRENIKTWFNNYQDRVTGDYKKSINTDLKWVGIALAMICNINVLTISSTILSNGNLRDSLVHQAELTVLDTAAVDKFNLVTSGKSGDETLDAFDKQYNQLVDQQMLRLDSTANWFKTSGLPIGWEMPRTKNELYVEYYRRQVELLKEIRSDTVQRTRGRYCMVNAQFDHAKINKDSLHKFITRLITNDGITRPAIDTLAEGFGLKIDREQAATILYFFNTPADSLNFGKCLRNGDAKKIYEECLADCSCIERNIFEEQILADIDTKIANKNQLMKMYDKPFKFWPWIKDFFTRPWKAASYNLRSPRDWVVFFIGTILMGLLATVGANNWFQLLVTLFKIRNAGSKPTKRD
ncbi:MAG: hypothetical protein WDO14_12785 [Bacteroidota bacterium]